MADTVKIAGYRSCILPDLGLVPLHGKGGGFQNGNRFMFVGMFGFLSLWNDVEWE